MATTIIKWRKCVYVRMASIVRGASSFTPFKARPTPPRGDTFRRTRGFGLHGESGSFEG